MPKIKLRQRIEDRLAIKATQRLRRRITTKEATLFFLHNRGKLDNVEIEYNKKIDQIINDYLETLK